MAFSISIDKRLSVGHRIGKIFTVTDVQTAGNSAVTGLGSAPIILATNTTDNVDTFKEIESTTTRGTVTLTSGTNDDDGKMLVLGR